MVATSVVLTVSAEGTMAAFNAVMAQLTQNAQGSPAQPTQPPPPAQPTAALQPTTTTAILQPTAALQPSQAPPPPPVPTPTLGGSQFHSSGKDKFIYYRDCFDLDEGITSAGVDNRCEFTFGPGADASGSTLEFIPNPPAAFAFSGVFMSEPGFANCQGSTKLSSQTDPNIAIMGYYVCFVTREGRYGWMYFKTMDPVNGMVFDWVTYQ
jgi:hypothetical protein